MVRQGGSQAGHSGKQAANDSDLSFAALPPGQNFKSLLQMTLQPYLTGRIEYNTFKSVDRGSAGFRCHLSLGKQHHNVASGFGVSREEAEQRAARVCQSAIESGTLRLKLR